MDSVGWSGWDADRLEPWLYRILPAGWFFAIHEESGKIMGTCMATHDPTWEAPFCGEVGWTAVHPDHQGNGIGRALIGAVLDRFLADGYCCIHLYTEIWRLAALKVYLQLGFVPYLVPPETIEEWEKICSQLAWSFIPENWPANLDL
jgi:mycothiol synthase